MGEVSFCPSCDGRIRLDVKPQKGQMVICPHCEAELVVVSVNPLELDWALELDEDLDEDEDSVWEEEEEEEMEWDEELSEDTDE